MFAVCVTFTIKPGQMQAFLPLMIKNARQSRDLEEGCLQFDICRDDDVIFLYEIYSNAAAFDLHLASDHFKTFDAAVSDMVAGKEVRIFHEVIR